MPQSLTDFLIYSGFGAGLVVVLLLVARLSRGFSAHAVLDSSPGFGLPDQQLVDHIFSARDLAYIEELAIPGLRKRFERERKELALAWLARVRAVTKTLRRTHQQTVRRTSGLSIATEVSLWFRFLAMFALCDILAICINIAGPYRVRGVARWTQQLGERISMVALPPLECAQDAVR